MRKFINAAKNAEMYQEMLSITHYSYTHTFQVVAFSAHYKTSKKFYNKVSFIVYQFMTDNLFPSNDRTNLGQPKNKGNISLLNVRSSKKLSSLNILTHSC